MLIIVEGPDGAGKSTLITDLQKQHDVNFEVRHARVPTKHPLLEYQDSLLGYRPLGKRSIICDRWHVGEAVYPQIVKRYTQWDIAVARHMDLFMQSRGATIVIALTDVATMEANVRRRNTRQDDRTIATIRPAAEAFDAFRVAQHIWNMQWIKHTYNYQSNVADQMSGYLYDRAHLNAIRASKLNQFTTYVGSHHVPYLLVGDTREVPSRNVSARLSKAPAFQPFRGTSGHYLLSHLDMDTNTYGLVNANDVDDVRAVWIAVGRPLVCALGARAAARLHLLGVPHGMVHHPQFVRRFHNSRGAEYNEMIQRALVSQRREVSWLT